MSEWIDLVTYAWLFGFIGFALGMYVQKRRYTTSFESSLLMEQRSILARGNSSMF